jgi:hypothetical protein
LVPLLKKTEIFGQIRSFALQRMKQFSKEKSVFVLLQLVASLKYENFDVKTNELLGFLTELGKKDKTTAMKIFWAINVESGNTIV